MIPDTSRSFVAALFLGLLAVPLAPPAHAQADSTGTLIITVTGIDARQGQVLISVFDTEEQWLQTPVYAEALAVDSLTADSLQWRVDDVPYGAYAVAVRHDENSSGDLDRDGLGIPTEPYGFSNNARGQFGPAPWKDATFDLAEARKAITIAVE